MFHARSRIMAPNDIGLVSLFKEDITQAYRQNATGIQTDCASKVKKVGCCWSTAKGGISGVP